MVHKISGGVVHDVPRDMEELIIKEHELVTIWQELTPLARNEWICWIISAKKQETRDKRITLMRTNLFDGKKRPCCWPGCKHR
jgi:uncharacterized protein YdeI (YjbR/CyaY-like superfamily)